MTKREMQLKLTRNRIARMEASREAAIKTLVKATLELPRLRKEEARLETALAKRKPKIDVELARTDETEARSAIAEAAALAIEAQDDDPIPDFLRRGMAAQKAVDDATARAEVLAQQAVNKKLKDKRRIEKLKIAQEVKHAELTGQRRKMPLTGKAALAALR